MPSEEQLRRWEALEVLAERVDDQNYLMNRVPLDQDHEHWLRARQCNSTNTTYQYTETFNSDDDVDHTKHPVSDDFVVIPDQKLQSESDGILGEHLFEQVSHPTSMF